MSRITLYEDVNFKVQGELLDGHFFMHVDVSHYNKSVRKKMLSVWEDIKEEVWLNGWNFIFGYNTNAKFAKLFGWKKVEEDGAPERMYVWALK